MNCPKCGAPMEDDAKFCVTCGASIQAVMNEQSGQEVPAPSVGQQAPVVQAPPVQPPQAPTCILRHTAGQQAPVVQAPPVQPPQAPTSPIPTGAAKVSGIQIAGYSLQSIIEFCVGTIIIIIGLIRIFSAGTTISTTSFGADFYTYAYRGIVAITEMLASIEVSLGWVIVAIGAAIDIKALRK